MTLSIHDLDPDVERRIRDEARRTGQSINRTLKRLLAEAVGCSAARPRKREDFSEFCGIWTEEEAREFEEAIADQEEIYPEDRQ